MNHNRVLSLALITGLLITVLVFIGGCYYPATEGEEGGGFDWTIIIFLVLIFAVFYFLMIRPQRKKQKEQRELMEGLQKGDRVITIGGIYGQIESLTEDSVVLKIESGGTIRVARNSIAGKREG
jgi:preprotein translocase subunit YajC